MPDDTPWMNDPDFHNLSLAEKHKFLLQADPDYKGLPGKEQVKALDAIHYGSLGQIPGEGISLKGAGTAAWQAIKGMVPPPPQGAPLSKEFWFGKTLPSFEPSKGGLAQDVGEATHEYQRARQAGAGPVAAGTSAGTVGAGSFLTGLSNIEQEKLAEQGEGGKIIGQSAVPAAAAALPLVKEPVRAGMRAVGELTPPGKYGAQTALNVAGAIQHPLPTLGKYAIKKLFGETGGPDIRAARAEMEADILSERQKRSAAYAEMQEDFSNRAIQQAKDLEKRVTDAEKARQREITDWAKLDKVNEADHAAFEDRMNEIEGERQSALADMERLKEQHAAALNARKAPKKAPTPPTPAPSPFAGMTSTAAPIGNAPLPEVPQGQPTPFPQVQRPGGMTPPPAPTSQIPVSERPTVGSQVAAKQKASVLEIGKKPIPLGVEPDMSNPQHVKIINDEIGQGINANKLAELRVRSRMGDLFARYLVDQWARNR